MARGGGRGCAGPGREFSDPRWSHPFDPTDPKPVRTAQAGEARREPCNVGGVNFSLQPKSSPTLLGAAWELSMVLSFLNAREKM